jgi:hypothetical protein
MFEYKLVIEGIHFNDKESEECHWEVEDYDDPNNEQFKRILHYYDDESSKSLGLIYEYYNSIDQVVNRDARKEGIERFNYDMYDAIRIRIKCNSKEHQLDNKVIAESIIKTR